MARRHDPDRTITSVSLLAEPVRRSLYEHVVAADGPVDRDTAAAAVGIGRPLAAFHLDRLVDGGLLEAEYRRRSGRSGPGAGRPAKFYRRTRGAEIEFSLPPRRYALAADVLAEAIERSADRHAADEVAVVARERGHELAKSIPGAERRTAPREALFEALAVAGYEPQVSGGTIRLRNCPFDALIAEHRRLTCGMNLAMLEAVAEDVPGAGVRATRIVEPGYCCVGFEPAD